MGVLPKAEVSVYFTRHAIKRFRERQNVGASISNNKVRQRMRASLLRSTRIPTEAMRGVKRLANSVYLYDAERRIIYVLIQKRDKFWVATCITPRGELKGSLTRMGFTDGRNTART